MSIIVRSNSPENDAKVNTTESKVEAATDATTQSAPEASDAPEQKESSEESEPSETEDKESEAESEDEPSQQSEDEPKDEAEKPKKKGGFQRRIDKLNAAKAAAQQEAEYWKRLALEGAGGSKKEAPSVESTVTQATEGKPKPDSFETHAEYVEAIADWKAEQKLRERDERDAKSRLQAEQGKRVQTYAEKAKAFSEKTEDFAEVLSDVDDVPLSQAVREIILESENGPELAYELAKNREEYARVCALSPLAAAREMGKLEARIAARTSAETKPEPKKITKAPKPLEPVTASGKGKVSKSLDDPTLSQAEYERLRREQMKRRGA